MQSRTIKLSAILAVSLSAVVQATDNSSVIAALVDNEIVTATASYVVEQVQALEASAEAAVEQVVAVVKPALQNAVAAITAAVTTDNEDTNKTDVTTDEKSIVSEVTEVTNETIVTRNITETTPTEDAPTSDDTKKAKAGQVKICQNDTDEVTQECTNECIVQN